MFEIMASGSALLTNENDDLPMLFPAGSYYTYKTDHSNIVSVANEIIHDIPKREAAVKLGVEAIRTRHSHQVRIDELLTIIKSL
jgi:spore maturation protein CgeB